MGIYTVRGIRGKTDSIGESASRYEVGERCNANARSGVDASLCIERPLAFPRGTFGFAGGRTIVFVPQSSHGFIFCFRQPTFVFYEIPQIWMKGGGASIRNLILMMSYRPRHRRRVVICILTMTRMGRKIKYAYLMDRVCDSREPNVTFSSHRL